MPNSDKKKINKRESKSKRKSNPRTVYKGQQHVGPKTDQKPYNVKTFVTMWKEVERNDGKSTEEIENSKVFKAANKKIFSTAQSSAQYGRLLPHATDVRNASDCDCQI
jgi:hypothetical protein